MGRWLFIFIALAAAPALAQKEKFFGKGKPLVFREEGRDRQFAKTKFAKALANGTDDPNCQQLLGAMLTLLAEIMPTLHQVDANFVLDPALINAAQVQLGTVTGAAQVGYDVVQTPRWPALDYLHAMVRRVLIDKRVPDEWLATAEAINPTVEIIDLGKLKMANEKLKLVDSTYFTLPALRDRYEIEFLRANSAVTTDVLAAFRDAYLDREVAWGDLTLLDTGVKAQKRFVKGKKVPPGMEELGAVLQWTPFDPHKNEINYFKRKPPPPVILYVHLNARQFIDLERVPIGKRMLVKGRFWEMNQTVTEVEIKEALLFEDRDFSAGVVLADPNAVVQCPLAVNDLTGTAPVQPGGFRH
ncbi:MAG: hypothetical protein JNK82_15995 [Myxococcaceae bacterium]|nr:hypothetical protein [Myxococcaceae bacterium]